MGAKGIIENEYMVKSRLSIKAAKNKQNESTIYNRETPESQMCAPAQIQEKKILSSKYPILPPPHEKKRINQRSCFLAMLEPEKYVNNKNHDPQQTIQKLHSK